MKTFIQNLFKKWSCCHEWEPYHRNQIWDSDFDMPHTIIDTFICKQCGKIKQVKL
jgi:hypothetical protein